jgi:hypothetical protein
MSASASACDPLAAIPPTRGGSYDAERQLFEAAEQFEAPAKWHVLVDAYLAEEAEQTLAPEYIPYRIYREAELGQFPPVAWFDGLDGYLPWGELAGLYGPDDSYKSFTAQTGPATSRSRARSSCTSRPRAPRGCRRGSRREGSITASRRCPRCS